MIKKWKKTKTEVVTENKIFTLRKVTTTSPKDGKMYPFFYLDTLDWVNIIPLTKDNEVVMIRQYRHGNEQITLEIPGGMTDKTDISPEDAALRELIEETGYTGTDVIRLGSCSPNPAIFNNMLHVFLVKDVEKKVSQDLESTEDIEVVKINISQIPTLIKNGEITHALVIAAFYYYFNSIK